jgi:hypothetical protein
MYALLLSVFVFEGRAPQVVVMPFVQSMSHCESMRTNQPDAIQDGMKIVSICYPLDSDKIESLRFSADTALKGIVD